MTNFKCRQCNSYTFGNPAQRDSKGKPICKWCLEKQQQQEGKDNKQQ